MTPNGKSSRKLKIPCANNTCGFDPHHRHKKEALQLVWRLSFYLRRVSGSNSTTLHSRGAISPAGCCSVRGRPPPPALQAARNRKVLGCFSFYPLTFGPSSHGCLHRETADDVLEGVINAERKKGIGAFHGSKGYGRFRCFFVTFSDCSGWFRLRCIWMPTRSSGMRSAKG